MTYTGRFYFPDATHDWPGDTFRADGSVRTPIWLRGENITRDQYEVVADGNHRAAGRKRQRLIGIENSSFGRNGRANGRACQKVPLLRPAADQPGEKIPPILYGINAFSRDHMPEHYRLLAGLFAEIDPRPSSTSSDWGQGCTHIGALRTDCLREYVESS